MLKILIKALESFQDLVLIESIVMCLTRLQPMLRAVRILSVFLSVSQLACQSGPQLAHQGNAI